LAREAHCSAERNCLPLHFYGGEGKKGEGIKVKEMKTKEKTNQIKITLKSKSEIGRQ
jgi:hypothetical protein